MFLQGKKLQCVVMRILFVFVVACEDNNVFARCVPAVAVSTVSILARVVLSRTSSVFESLAEQNSVACRRLAPCSQLSLSWGQAAQLNRYHF